MDGIDARATTAAFLLVAGMGRAVGAKEEPGITPSGGGNQGHLTYFPTGCNSLWIITSEWLFF